jgi:hypothetical protein
MWGIASARDVSHMKPFLLHNSLACCAYRMASKDPLRARAYMAWDSGDVVSIGLFYAYQGAQCSPLDFVAGNPMDLKDKRGAA